MTQKLDYMFTVAGVDSGGRIGESSAFSEVITLDGKLKIRKSILMQVWIIFTYHSKIEKILENFNSTSSKSAETRQGLNTQELY